MNVSPVSPPRPAGPRPAAPRRASGSPEVRAIQIGVIGTIVVHLLLLWLVPKVRWSEVVAVNGPAAPASSQAFEVQLAPPEIATPAVPMPAPAAPPKFVETNPAAPDNVPDKTSNVAAQNQQVAQAIPTPNGKSDAPLSQGDPDHPSTAIVSGQRAELRSLPVAPAPPPPQPVSANNAPNPPQRAQTPLPGSELAQGENAASPGTDVAAPGPSPSTVSNRVQGNPGVTATNSFTIGLNIPVDPQHPQIRPSLTTTAVQARPTPLLNNFTGTEHTGLTAYDAKWSSYGEYLQLLVNSVDAQWERIIRQSSIYPPVGSRVMVTFRLNARGEIAAILRVGGSANHDAQDTCISAIVRTPRADGIPFSYGPWSADMIATLGDAQELTFEFLYE